MHTQYLKSNDHPSPTHPPQKLWVVSLMGGLKIQGVLKWKGFKSQGPLYSGTCLERPLLSGKCGLSRQVVSGDRFKCIELQAFVSENCALSWAVHCQCSSLSRKGSLYDNLLAYVVFRFLFMIEHVMPLCLTISWVYTVAMLVQNIVYEKEQRLKEVYITTLKSYEIRVGVISWKFVDL